MPSPAKSPPARIDAAIRNVERQLAAHSANVTARYNLALLLLERGRRAEARRHLERIRKAAPQFAPAAFTLGQLALDDDDLATAEPLLAVAATAPALSARARFALAEVLKRRGRLAEAATLYSWVIDQAPPTPAPYLQLACLMMEADPLDALDTADAGLARFPASADLHCLRGQALLLAGRPEDAIAALRRSSAIDPSFAVPVAELPGALRKAGRWQEEPEALAAVRKLLADPEHSVGSIGSLPALHFPFDGRELRTIMERSAAIHRPPRPLPPIPTPERRGPLVIGYLSPDFRDHPIANVVTDVLAAHDPARVRVVALSEGRDDGSVARRDIIDAADTFIDLRGLSDRDAALRIRDAGVHILVDLSIATQHHRRAIPAMRPAPIQAAWLGLPATSGAPWIDYLLVDDIVAPPEHADRFTETLIYLPHGYHPARKLFPLPPHPGRAAVGLPEDAVVFGCFNGYLKVDGTTFDSWMEILRGVPKSVLWLRGAPTSTRAIWNAAAEARGVAAERLIFAPGVPDIRDHFARLRCIDLMLDCLIYGAHTTCLDSLRAGVPMLTVLGECFAARVGASILGRAGLPELVLPDRAAFIAEAIRLGTDPAARAGLRDKLARAVPASKVFDPEAQARALEDAYAAMWANRRA